MIIDSLTDIVHDNRHFDSMILYMTSSCTSSGWNSSKCGRKGDPYSSVWDSKATFSQGALK